MGLIKREALRLKLSKSKTLRELELMLHEIKEDPESKKNAEGFYLYNSKSLKMIDEITWAMYYIRKKKKSD